MLSKLRDVDHQSKAWRCWPSIEGSKPYRKAVRVVRKAILQMQFWNPAVEFSLTLHVGRSWLSWYPDMSTWSSDPFQILFPESGAHYLSIRWRFCMLEIIERSRLGLQGIMQREEIYLVSIWHRQSAPLPHLHTSPTVAVIPCSMRFDWRTGLTYPRRLAMPSTSTLTHPSATSLGRFSNSVPTTPRNYPPATHLDDPRMGICASRHYASCLWIQ